MNVPYLSWTIKINSTLFNFRRTLHTKKIHHLAPLHAHPEHPGQPEQPEHSGQLEQLEQLAQKSFSSSTPNLVVDSPMELDRIQHWNTPSHTRFFQVPGARRRRQASIIMDKVADSSPFKNKFHPNRNHLDGGSAVPLNVDHILTSPYNSGNHFNDHAQWDNPKPGEVLRCCEFIHLYL